MGCGWLLGCPRGTNGRIVRMFRGTSVSVEADGDPKGRSAAQQARGAASRRLPSRLTTVWRVPLTRAECRPPVLRDRL
jgi:hypothetical protein